MIEIRPLKNVTPDTLYQAFSAAFRDYEMQLNKQELAHMLQRRGFDPGLSFGAFDRSRLVAFTFNGIGIFEGLPTAYDTGTGTVTEYRGQGLAKQIFTHSIPFLKEAGVKRYLLEVLQHNTSAVNLYLKLGFEITREFHYFVQKTESLKFDAKALMPECRIQAVEIAALSGVDYSDFTSSWQNSQPSILRGSAALKAMAVYLDGGIIAYCIYDPGSGDIASLAVAQDHRRSGVGTQLLNSVLQDLHSGVVKVINIPLEAQGATAFLSSLHMVPSGKQFEMIREL
jgi:ribosomal protein S18 acetylase RimI-like enzyme